MKKSNEENKNKTSDLLNEAIQEDVESVNKEKLEKKKPKKKWVKYILYFSLIVIITAVVLSFSLFGDSDTVDPSNPERMLKVYETIPGLFSNITSSGEHIWFFIAFILVIIAVFALNALSLFLFARLYTKKYKYHQALANHAIGTFYSNITPGASGGQFAQVFTFKKQGIQVSTAASIMVMNYIIYQSVLVICGLISMVKINDILAIQVIDLTFGDFTFPIPVVIFIIVGFALNAFIIMLLFLMSYSRRLHNFVLNKGINLLAKLHLIKHPEEKRENLRLQVENFRVELRRLQSNFIFTFFIVLLTFFTIFLNDCMPCICGYALYGFADDQYNFVSFMNNCFSCFCYMNFHQMMCGLIPLPGSAGISEFVFNRLFTCTITGPDGIGILSNGYFSNPAFGKGGVNLLMLLWRFGTFYIPFLICGIVSATYKSKGVKKADKFYDIENNKKTLLTIQIETLDERKLTSTIVYTEKQKQKLELIEEIKNKRNLRKEKSNSRRKKE